VVCKRRRTHVILSTRLTTARTRFARLVQHTGKSNVATGTHRLRPHEETWPNEPDIRSTAHHLCDLPPHTLPRAFLFRSRPHTRISTKAPLYPAALAVTPTPLMTQPPVTETSPSAPTESVEPIDSHRGIVSFVKRHHTELLIFLSMLLSSPDKAEDIAQDAYVTALANGGERTPDHFRHLLFKTARHRALDTLRRGNYKLRRSFKLTHEHEHQPGPEELENRMLTTRERRRLVKAMTELPPLYQLVVRRAYLEEAPQGEVARELGLTTRTIRNYLHQARTYCALRLEGHPEMKAKELTKL
jgi:RNA polymerase sigma factor (sigma-70 family)